MGLDSSKGTGASGEMLLSVSFRKSLICVAKMVKSAAAGSSVDATVVTAVRILVRLRSKIGVSSSLSLDSSGVAGNIGLSSNSSAVSVCAEAVVPNGYA
uniref:Uncharacterized protein n=1 Tax=Romanomermis culicivorax TaxID=13658 RepID=A0A915IKB6_ROMCU